jgi:hypothetical protein
MRIVTTIPNSTWQDIKPYLEEEEKRLQWDEAIESLKVTKNYRMDTCQIYLVMKTHIPLGKRDILVNNHIVKFED